MYDSSIHIMTLRYLLVEWSYYYHYYHYYNYYHFYYYYYYYYYHN